MLKRRSAIILAHFHRRECKVERQICARILTSYDFSRSIAESFLQLCALIVEIIKVRGVGYWQLVQTAYIPPAGEQKTCSGRDQGPQAQLRRSEERRVGQAG